MFSLIFIFFCRLHVVLTQILIHTTLLLFPFFLKDYVVHQVLNYEYNLIVFFPHFQVSNLSVRTQLFDIEIWEGYFCVVGSLWQQLVLQGFFSVYYSYHITVKSKEGLLFPLYIREDYGHLVALELSLYFIVKHCYYFSLLLMKGRNHLFF